VRVVLLGPPGAGKGTQAAELARFLGVPHVASGELFRDHQRRDTELGRLARTFMERGVLVPDEVTIGMVNEWIDAPEQTRGYLLDGFPRTLTQAEALDNAVSGSGGLNCVAYIKVKTNELVARLSGRLICRQCQSAYHVTFAPPEVQGKCDACGAELYQRPDDSEEAVKTRLDVFSHETEPLISYYQAQDKLVEVDGVGGIGEVQQRLREAVGSAALASRLG
jgi:adenylate kinase